MGENKWNGESHYHRNQINHPSTGSGTVTVQTIEVWVVVLYSSFQDHNQ